MLIAVTSGEPAGIGPEICLRLRDAGLPARIVVIGDRSLLPGVADVAHVPLARPRQAGRLDPGNARYVLALLDRAIAGCLSGEYQAMVTAPVQKSVINDAGIAFTGHTEYLAERCRADVVMMLVGGGLRVALATTHLPLTDVPSAITRASLLKALHVMNDDLKKKFHVSKPRILVAGLNPQGEAAISRGDRRDRAGDRRRGRGGIDARPDSADTFRSRAARRGRLWRCTRPGAAGPARQLQPRRRRHSRAAVVAPRSTTARMTSPAKARPIPACRQCLRSAPQTA